MFRAVPKALLAIGMLAAAAGARGEWVAGGFLGAAHTQANDLRIRRPALETDLLFSGVGYRGESFQSPLYYGYRAGYFRGFLGVEAEFIHMKIFADVNRTVPVSGTLRGAAVSGGMPMSAVVRAFSISHGLNLLLANLCFRKTLAGAGPRGWLMLTARLGVGGSIPHVESDILGDSDQHYQAGGLAAQAAGGLEFRIWRGLYAVTEYKYTRTRQNVDIVGGTAETHVNSHHGIAGLDYHF